MNSVNKNKMIAAIGAIVFASYQIVLFVLAGFSGHNSVFWISWVFMLIAFASVSISGIFLREKITRLKDWIFGYPIIKHGILYLIIEFLTSTIFIIFEDKILWLWAFVVQFVVFVFHVVIVISCFMAKDIVEDISFKIKDKTGFIKLLRIDAQMLVENCNNPEAKRSCQELADAIRYSDPMSNENLFEMEKEIALILSNCSNAIKIEDYDMVKKYCDTALLILLERNEKCKALK